MEPAPQPKALLYSEEASEEAFPVEKESTNCNTDITPQLMQADWQQKSGKPAEKGNLEGLQPNEQILGVS